MTEPKIHHLRNNWDATTMLSHALERIDKDESVLVLFYEDNNLCRLSSHMTHEQAVWMMELAKAILLHECITHEWEEV